MCRSCLIPPCVFSRLPFWKLLTNVDSGPKVERELRIFSNRLRRHQLGEGVISLSEHSTTLLSDMVRQETLLSLKPLWFTSSTDCVATINQRTEKKHLSCEITKTVRWGHGSHFFRGGAVGQWLELLHHGKKFMGSNLVTGRVLSVWSLFSSCLPGFFLSPKTCRLELGWLETWRFECYVNGCLSLWYAGGVSSTGEGSSVRVFHRDENVFSTGSAERSMDTGGEPGLEDRFTVILFLSLNCFNNTQRKREYLVIFHYKTNTAERGQTEAPRAELTLLRVRRLLVWRRIAENWTDLGQDQLQQVMLTPAQRWDRTWGHRREEEEGESQIFSPSERPSSGIYTEPDRRGVLWPINHFRYHF